MIYHYFVIFCTVGCKIPKISVADDSAASVIIVTLYSKSRNHSSLAFIICPDADACALYVHLLYFICVSQADTSDRTALLIDEL